MRKARIALLVFVMVLTACGAAGGGGPDTTEPGDTTTTQPDTPGTNAPTTTTSPAPTTTQSPATTSTTSRSPVVDQADGSGCTPGPGQLPDGEWYGHAVDVTTDELEFDLACWFSGEAAVQASAEDGEESPPPNDYYIRNNSELVRVLDVAGHAEVVWYPDLGDPSSESTVTYADWLVAIDGRAHMPGIWVEVDGGVVTNIHEQWVP